MCRQDVWVPSKCSGAGCPCLGRYTRTQPRHGMYGTDMEPTGGGCGLLRLPSRADAWNPHSTISKQVAQWVGPSRAVITSDWKLRRCARRGFAFSSATDSTAASMDRCRRDRWVAARPGNALDVGQSSHHDWVKIDSFPPQGDRMLQVPLGDCVICTPLYYMPRSCDCQKKQGYPIPSGNFHDLLACA